jgi:hypothetical protein
MRSRTDRAANRTESLVNRPARPFRRLTIENENMYFHTMQNAALDVSEPRITFERGGRPAGAHGDYCRDPLRQAPRL